MDIPLHVHAPEYSGMPAFIVRIEADRLGVTARGDMAWLMTQAFIKRSKYWDQGPQGRYPVLLDLHGVLCSSNALPPAGVSLHPVPEIPLVLPDASTDYLLNLAFPFPRSFAQQLEEERSTAQGRQDLRLKIRLWGGVLAVMPNASGTSMLRVHTEGIDPEIRIARSDWLDGLLANTGYPARRYVELSGPSEDQPAETQAAVAHLNEAWRLFRHEHYREAVQRCRQAKDALLGENKPTWTQTTLGPVIGVEKAAMINDSLNALNHLTTKASHGENSVEVDREVAEYVIGSLTLILQYVGRKLK